MLKQIKGLFKIENILLFLIAFELYGKHHFLIFTLFLFLILQRRIEKGVLNRDFFWVLLWGVSYFLFGVRTYSIVHIPALICAYMIGYSMTSDKESVFRLLLIIGVGYGLEGILTLYYSDGAMVYAEDEMSRGVISLWGEPKGLTSMDVILFIFSGILVYILMNKEIKIGWKVLAVIFELGFVYDSLRIAARSPLFFCPLIIAVSILAYNSRKQSSRSLFLFGVIIVTLITLYSVDILGIKTIYENSFLSTRLENQYDGGAVNNSRFRLHSRFFDVWTMDLWGGLHNKIGFYFHNCWLDMYAHSGVLGFITFIILTFCFVLNFFYVYRRTEADERSIWAGVFTAFMLPLFFEPLYWAAPAYFAFFFIFSGMLSKRRKVLNSKIIALYR